MTAPLFRTSRRIEFYDTDMAGIVHFSNFFRFMESAEVDFLMSRGLSVALPWEGHKLGFPRVAASCDYLRPVRFLDVIETTVSIQNLGRKSITYAFEFFKEDKIVAKGQVSSVCCRVDGAKMESMVIPESLRAKLMGE
jgi:acyl-CoA thioester hydrolase